jgi:hypothetical protein
MRSMRLMLVATLALSACSKGGEDTTATCEAPRANAGVDVAITLGGGTTLDASASTTCVGTEATRAYTWSIEQAPVGSTVDDTMFGASNGSADALSVPFTPDVVGSYVIALVVSDGTTSSTPDLVVITVTSEDAVPSADAGDDATTKINGRVVLDGSGSRDPEGSPLTYSWALASKPDGSTLFDADAVFDSHSESASIVPDVPGTYVISLIVSDGAHFSEPDFVTVTAGALNSQPYADAGSSTTLAACASNTLTLDAYGSYDPDGDALTYRWWLTSAPADSMVDDASFDDATKPNARFTWDVVGTYTFSLQVSDGVNTSAIDEVSYTMVDASKNKAPNANAGADQTIEGKADCTVADYASDCEDCENATFTVDGSGSNDPDGDTLAFYWRETTSGSTVGPLNILNPSAAVTEIAAPPVPATLTTGKKTTFDVTLDVSDCAKFDDDSVKLTITCTGKKI